VEALTFLALPPVPLAGRTHCPDPTHRSRAGQAGIPLRPSFLKQFLNLLIW